MRIRSGLTQTVVWHFYSTRDPHAITNPSAFVKYLSTVLEHIMSSMCSSGTHCQNAYHVHGMYTDMANVILDTRTCGNETGDLCCRRKQAEVDRLIAAEQEADKQLMDAAMRKDAQDQAADKQLKAERKAEQLNYRSGFLPFAPGLSSVACVHIFHFNLCFEQLELFIAYVVCIGATLIWAALTHCSIPVLSWFTASACVSLGAQRYLHASHAVSDCSVGIVFGC